MKNVRLISKERYSIEQPISTQKVLTSTQIAHRIYEQWFIVECNNLFFIWNASRGGNDQSIWIGAFHVDQIYLANSGWRLRGRFNSHFLSFFITENCATSKLFYKYVLCSFFCLFTSTGSYCSWLGSEFSSTMLLVCTCKWLNLEAFYSNDLGYS